MFYLSLFTMLFISSYVYVYTLYMHAFILTCMSRSLNILDYKDYVNDIPHVVSLFIFVMINYHQRIFISCYTIKVKLVWEK